MPRSRKITIIVLIVLTLVLAGISVYIAIRLNQQDQAPTDTSAAVLCGSVGVGNPCGSPSCQNNCQVNTSNQRTGSMYVCGSVASVPTVQLISAPGTCPPQIPTLSEGDACDPNVNGVCDQNGALTCIRCGSNTNASGQGRCSFGAGNSQSAINACGGLVSSPTPTPSSGLQCPNGTGTAGGCLVFLCPNGCGTDNRCQGDDVGVQIFAENGSCSATLDGRCGQIDVMQGSNISASNPGSFCGVKVDAVSGEQITCGQAICNVVVTAECNQTCTGTGQGNCASGLQCLSGVCRLPSNPTSTTCQTSTQPTCNQACTGSGQGNCATADLQCISGVCRNPNVPNDSDCIADPAPTCGGACGAGGVCPTGNVCNSSNICVLTQCLNNSNCTNNGCTLPSTALFSEGGDNKLLIGVMLIIVGLLATQVKFNTVFENLSTFSDKLGFRFENKVDKNIENKISSVSETKNKRVKKSRKKFEKKF